MSNELSGKRIAILVADGFEQVEMTELGHAKRVVVDRENYHLFQPLVYQVAMAQLAGTDISASIRGVLAHQLNARVLLGEVTSLDLDRRQQSSSRIILCQSLN